MKGFSPYVVFYTMHLIGLIFGLGGVTMTDVLSAYGFFKPESMRDHAKSFKLLSLVIWVGLFFLIVSGIALVYISKVEMGGQLASNMYEVPMMSAVYYLKLIVTGVIVVNGLFLNLKVTPAFEHAVMLDNFTETQDYRKALRLGLLSGGLSFVGWWSIFFMGIYLFRIVS
jgi:hypothetical protein